MFLQFCCCRTSRSEGLVSHGKKAASKRQSKKRLTFERPADPLADDTDAVQLKGISEASKEDEIAATEDDPKRSSTEGEEERGQGAEGVSSKINTTEAQVSGAVDEEEARKKTFEEERTATLAEEEESRRKAKEEEEDARRRAIDAAESLRRMAEGLSPKNTAVRRETKVEEEIVVENETDEEEARRKTIEQEKIRKKIGEDEAKRKAVEKLVEERGDAAPAMKTREVSSRGSDSFILNVPSESSDSEDESKAHHIFPPFSLKKRDAVAKACLEHDWVELTSKGKFIPEEERAQVRDLLQTNYVWILPLYRKLSTQDTPPGATKQGVSPFGVYRQAAVRLLDSNDKGGIGLLDKTKLTKTMAEEKFKEASTREAHEKEKHVVYNDTSLVRYQFVFWLTLIAKAKFPGEQTVDAMAKLFDALSDLCQRYSAEIKYLFIAGSDEQIQRIHDKSRKLVGNIFVLYAEGNKDSMNIVQWQTLVKDVGLCSTANIHKHEVPFLYRMGLTTVADEQYSDHFLHMSFKEFQRGITACIFLGEYHRAGACSSDRLAQLLAEFFDRDLKVLWQNEKHRMKEIPTRDGIKKDGSKARLSAGPDTPKGRKS